MNARALLSALVGIVGCMVCVISYGDAQTDQMEAELIQQCGDPPSQGCAYDYWVERAQYWLELKLYFEEVMAMPSYPLACTYNPGYCAQVQYEHGLVTEYWLYSTFRAWNYT